MLRAVLKEWEKPVIVMIMFLSMGPYLTVPKAIADLGINSAWLSRYGLILLCGVVVLVNCRLMSKVSVSTLPSIALVMFAAASAFWSADVRTTILMGGGLLVLTAFSVIVALKYPFKQFVELLLVAFLLAALGSIAASYGLPFKREWQGLFVQKNVLGAHMAMAAIGFFLYINEVSYITKRWLAVLGFSLSTSLAVLSKSKTALVIYVLVLGGLALASLVRKTGAYKTLTAVVLLAASTVAVFVLRRPGIIGNYTLTNRTLIWERIISVGLTRPWLGSGYGAFWSDLTKPYDALGDKFSSIAHGHNGFLDMFLELGIVGLVGLLAVLIWAVYKNWTGIKVYQEALWAISFFAFFIMLNLTESAILYLRHNSIYWILFVIQAVQYARRPEVDTP